MANLDSFNPLVVPYLPGAEIGVLRLHARRVLREFLRRTTVWREQISFPTVGTSAMYRFAPTSGEVASILRVYRAGQQRPLPVATEIARSANVAEGEPRAWHAALPQVVSLYPAPDGVYAMVAEVALSIPIQQLAPDDDAFDEDVFAHHGEDIASGIIGYMMAMPGKPWTQVKMATTYLQRYENAMRALRARVRDGGQTNVSTLHGPRIA